MSLIEDPNAPSSSSSSSSSQLSQSKKLSSPVFSESAKLDVPTPPLELPQLPTQPIFSIPNPTWSSRVVRRVSSRHPRLYERLNKIYLYIRGPRPKVDLARVSFSPIVLRL